MSCLGGIAKPNPGSAACDYSPYSNSLITVLIRKEFNPAIGRWKDWSRARSGQPSPSAKDHTVICAIARFHIINPWSRAKTMAWVRDQTPSLSKTFEA
jgi:hypothetical protein